MAPGPRLGREITLTASGTYSHADGNLNLSIDGTSVALNPEGGLEHGVEYTVGIGSAVTDMVGNGATQKQLNFAMAATEDDRTADAGIACRTDQLSRRPAPRKA